uniref:Uncharacterized protein MANES_16G085100 n=1 Tax=Rhizophora mucronata TaxID=61149 RepID=A0A2P2JTV4_RHIMU
MVKTMALLDAEVNSFNDFGEELCLLPESTVSISGIDRDMMVYLSNGKMSTEALRSFEMPLIGCKKIEASDINDADPRGLLCHEETRAGPSDREHTKMRKVGIAGTGTMQNAGFPSQMLSLWVIL